MPQWIVWKKHWNNTPGKFFRLTNHHPPTTFAARPTIENVDCSKRHLTNTKLFLFVVHRSYGPKNMKNLFLELTI